MGRVGSCVKAGPCFNVAYYTKLAGTVQVFSLLFLELFQLEKEVAWLVRFMLLYSCFLIAGSLAIG